MPMTPKSFSILCYVAGAIFALLHLFVAVSFAAPLHLNGNWSTPFGDDDGPWNLGQTYNLSLGHDLTSAINFSGNVRYATTEQQEADKTTTLAPSATISLNNDLFRFNLGGSQNERQSGNNPTSINRNWSANLSSNFDSKLWPQLRLSYSESNSTTDASPATIDTDSDSFAASIDYNWEFIKLLYNYRTSTSTNNINNSQSETDSHSTNVQMMKSLFDNRLSLSAAHQYSVNNSAATTSVTGGLLTFDLTAAATYAGIDNTPLTDPLPPVPALNDRDMITATSAELPGIGDMLNVVVQSNLQTFNRLNIYFDRNLTTTTQQRLHWSFYTSQDNSLWIPLNTTPTMVYLEEDGLTVARVTFSPPIATARYIKAVIETDPGFTSAFLTEVTAQEQVSATGLNDTVSNSSTSENIQASVNYRPWSKWQLGYSFSRNTSDSDRGVKSIQDNHAISSHLDLNRYFALSLSVSENTDEIEGLNEQRNRSYAFAYQATPLDSVNFSINGTRSDHFTGNTKDRSSDSISTNLATGIVPDLTANFTAMWNQSQNYVDDSSSNTTSTSYTANLMARINERLNLSYYYSYSEIGTHRLSLAYRPSDLTSLTASAMQSEDTRSYSSSLHWRITHKIQTDLRYSLSSNDQGDAHNSRFNLSWNISTYLSVRQSIDWSKSDTDSSWSGLVSASYNF